MMDVREVQRVTEMSSTSKCERPLPPQSESGEDMDSIDSGFTVDDIHVQC